MVKQITKYIAENDGSEHETKELAALHEVADKVRAEKAYSDYINFSYNGGQLLKKYSLDTYSIWEVRGEDPNCDMGGFHHQPRLGFFEGKLKDVILKAVTLPGWSTWGGGGSITKNVPDEVQKV